MKDLPAIARYMRLPEEQLRFPVELLNQGYEPNYLATYRPDELGGIDVQTLARLKRSVAYEGKLAAHKERVHQALERDLHWSDAVAKVIDECTSVSQVDSIARYLRSKKSAKTFSENNPNVEKLGQAILMLQGEPPKDLHAWVVEQTGVAPESAEELLNQTKRWLQLLMCEDAKLILTLQRAVLRNANVSLNILPEPAKIADTDSDEKATADLPRTGGDTPTAETPLATASAPTQEPSGEMVAAVATETAPTETAPTETAPTETAPTETAPTETAAAETTTLEASDGGDSVVVARDTSTSEAAESEAGPTEGSKESTVAPLIEQFHKGRKQPKGIKTKSLSDKQLSPRQRRRRWLRSIVESYAKLRKPLRALTPYQVLMFSRGIRSQIMTLQFQQDMRPLVQACRDSLCEGRHPLHPLLMEVAETGLREILLPRLQQDALIILEEDSNQELIESSVLHLQASLLQRPVRGHRILLIDAVGQKMAAVAMIDADGQLLGTGELPCNTSKADVVAQNVAMLGQWVHEHQITLVVLSNGVARRYLIHSIAELMKQSSEGSLYWTLVDRAGCDAYCMSRTSLVELPKISRRHRAAAWLAWRLQDPLRQILKIDPARLRLGSYQRELPQQELEEALHESISAAITKAGVDVFHADVEVLKRIPGMNEEAAKQIAADRQEGKITNRETLMQCLRSSLTEMQARQAIGFLRVFGSENTLDGTIIHPDDYRLAQRLIAHAQLPAPPATPEGWSKPDYEKLAAAHAAVASLAIESTLADETSSYGFDGATNEINPNFGVIDEGTEGESSPSVDETSETTADVVATEIAAAEPTAEESAVAEPTSDNAEVAAHLEEAATPSDTPESIVDAAATGETATNAAGTERADSRMPEIPDSPMARPALSVDAEKLARSWQVGRAKLMSASSSLQFPFADTRDFQYPVPIRSQVPRLDQLPTGTMLSALVIGVADFGVFVELGPDCSGLVHISRLADEFVEDPHQFVQVGDVIPVWVLSVDEKRKRVGLTAISPAAEEKRREAQRAEKRIEQESRGDRRPNRNDRGPRSNAPANASSAGGERTSNATGGDRRPAGVGRGGPGGGNQGGGQGRGGQGRGGDGGRAGGRNQGGRGRDERGRDRRDRNEGSDTDSAPRRPVKIERAQPEKPITEAMQQGKEPLRSFSDLMQFMKQPKPAAESPETPKPATPVENAPSSDSSSPSDNQGQDSDANTTA
jgi:transcriptional accessory protein Tex/SPT6